MVEGYEEISDSGDAASNEGNRREYFHPSFFMGLLTRYKQHMRRRRWLRLPKASNDSFKVAAPSLHLSTTARLC